MGKADVSFQTDADKVIVTGAKARYELPLLNMEEYPEMPSVSDSTKFTVNGSILAEMINGVAFSVSTNLSQKVFTAINMTIKDKKLRLVTTDMTRVSIRQRDINCEDEVNVNIPSKTMLELAKSMDGGDLDIEISNINIRFTFGQTTMVARLIDGKFFDVNQLFKVSPTIKVKMDKKELAESIDRALVIVTTEKTPIVLDFKDEAVKLSLKTNVQSFDEDVVCTKEGDDIRIGMNPAYVFDALKAAEDETVTLAMHNANSPMFILPMDDEADEYVYVVLPVNI
jgi:DNA polymerase-3 subunit beta